MVEADSLRPLPGRAAWYLGVSGPILVFGAEGQVGREVMALAKAWGIEVTGCNRAQADITNFSAVEAAISSAEPRVVLNAAAYTAVDRAETEKETAYAANVVGGELVARAAAARCLPIIHISTDYVFDGTKIGTYVETDPIAPLGVYGTTKAEGEARVHEKTRAISSCARPGFMASSERISSKRSCASHASERNCALWPINVVAQRRSRIWRKPSLRSIARGFAGLRPPGPIISRVPASRRGMVLQA
jgi:RmlD substrate binding domain